MTDDTKIIIHWIIMCTAGTMAYVGQVAGESFVGSFVYILLAIVFAGVTQRWVIR